MKNVEADSKREKIEQILDGDVSNYPDTVNKAIESAKSIGLSYSIIDHSSVPCKTTDDAEKSLGIDREEIIKTLILYASKEKEYVGVIITGADKLDTKKIVKNSGYKKLRFASGEQIESLTGYRIGGVCPTAINCCSLKYIDEEVVVKNSFVVGAGGDEYYGMKLKPSELAAKLKLAVIEASYGTRRNAEASMEQAVPYIEEAVEDLGREEAEEQGECGRV